MKWSVKMTSSTAFAIALLSLIVVNVLAYWHSLALVDVTRSVSRAHGAVMSLEHIRADIVDMESSLRGYVLSGNPSFAKPMQTALKRGNAELNQLSQEKTTDPVRQQALARLQSLVKQRLDMLQRLKEQCDQGNIAAAKEAVQSGAGDKLTEAIRQQAGDLEALEEQFLANTVNSLDLVNQQNLFATLAATLLAATVLLLISVSVTRQFVAQAQQAEQERREKETLTAMLGTIGDGVVVANTSGKFLVFNPAAENILGKGQLALPVEQWSQEYGLYRPDRTTKLPFEEVPLYRALQGESTDQIELYVLNDKTKIGRHISVTGRTLFHRNGEPRAGVVVFRDITQRKEAEQRLNEFYAMLSHELRTPLTSVRGSLGLLEGGVAGELPEVARELLAIAHLEVDRLIRLVNNILDLKKMEAGKLQLTLEKATAKSIVDTTLKSLQALAHESGVSLVQDVKPELKVKCDHDRLVQVLTNLVSNAIKFSPDNGLVGVSVTARGDNLRFSVSDQGPGIPEDSIHQLFAQYQQLHGPAGGRKGTGLGLAISKALVEQHGGTIGVETTKGAGSTFWFEIPADHSAAAV